MSNTSLILESLALIKDAKDRLDKTDPSKLSAIDAFHRCVSCSSGALLAGKLARAA